MSSSDEIIDIVDEHDHVVRQATRGEAYAKGLRHRCVFVLARDADDRIFVHRRTPTKAAFPSHYDMFVGGVVDAGETYDDAALREAEEELGVSGLPRPVPLFTFLYDAEEGRWWSRVYEVRCVLPVSPQLEEIDWHAFLTDAELERRLAENAEGAGDGGRRWTPDGLMAYELLKAARTRDA
ncbi:NUDIX domain-containing protein [Streptomyces sp. NPDC006645]|uniref:NUDIX hydrolase n=1 Tax=unclassified Streptomyces TaxID=2593676 RepID=UPI0033A97CFB